MPLEDFIITMFCRVEERLNALLGDRRLRQRGLAPKLADSGKARVNTDRPIERCSVGSSRYLAFTDFSA